MHYFGIRQFYLKPIQTYNVRTTYYHMQQNFDGPGVWNRGKDHSKLAMFFKASGWNRQNITPGVKWTFEGEAWDFVDAIAELWT